jgi:hypothetical protein
MTARLEINWQSARRRATQPSDPGLPMGVDLDLSRGATPSCAAALPYPAPEVGRWLVTCPDCGLRVVVTAAGRPDDPRTVRLACRLEAAATGRETAS